MTDERERVRLAAVASLDFSGSGPQERFDRITRVARQLLRVPSAEINIIEESTQYTKSPQRPPLTSRIPRADSICDVTVQQPDLLVIEDASADARFADRGSVTGDPHLRFYAGRPLTVGDGVRVGTICVYDQVPRDFTEEEGRVLEELGRWAERELREIASSSRAAELQRRLKPAALVLDDWSVAGSTLPAQDVAGDYASWRFSGDRLALEVVDVMGKGTGAAIIASAIRSAFQARPDAAPAEAVSAVNRQLLQDLTATATFATAFIAGLDTVDGRLSFVDAGHGLTMLLRADGSVERLTTAGLPIGIADDVQWEEHSRILQRGDTLFSCSDGVLDLYDGTLAALDRLAELVRHLDDEALFEHLAALALSAGAQDDVTALVLRRR
ncbi:Serine phosphatase RsbU, regulator of sigma subunit [Rathayibacter oskolensis]|uniref:Serine phosphatase RsbU, regulator of sigma subunit n=1 Tax=Rathayibacter oskolensis TaxID=1891671 RepID=A0A1X7NEP2_9MICO|nr:GAF domain-containing SpoIIE family protein phosphatase [Rathayibacter oskolensis]SMH36170.1 Serine phosphatase RsbU, regulator of sigma subunit [Rathayibacter oskolensis]